MHNVIADLQGANVGDVLLNEPMRKHTTWKIGGPADCLIIPDSKEQLVQAVKILHRHGVPLESIRQRFEYSWYWIKGFEVLLSSLATRFDTRSLRRGCCACRRIIFIH